MTQNTHTRTKIVGVCVCVVRVCLRCHVCDRAHTQFSDFSQGLDLPVPETVPVPVRVAVAVDAAVPREAISILEPKNKGKQTHTHAPGPGKHTHTRTHTQRLARCATFAQAKYKLRCCSGCCCCCCRLFDCYTCAASATRLEHAAPASASPAPSAPPCAVPQSV